MMDEARVRQQMDQVVELFKEDIATLRTGRATPALIEDITVSVYEGQQKMRLKELGAITTPDPRTLTFQPWDATILKEIKNGITAANLGFQPVIDGQLIRIVLPPLTEEQRNDYLKLLGRKTEAARVMIRDIRGEERHQLQEQQKAKEISEDVFRRQEEQLQKLTDEYIAQINELASVKEKEIRGES